MTTDVASASLGPHYAPEDPTLIKPWKGLIDGTTGVKYYWNPESNVTQYERPADPLSAPGVPPSASVPNLAPIPTVHSFQNNVSMTQQGQEMNQSYQSHGQQTFQPQQTHYNPQQPTPQFGEDTQQHQVTQGVHQQQIQQMPQGVQQNWYPMSQQSRDQPIQQLGQRMPQHLEQQTWQHEVQQPSHLQAQQFPNQQQQIPFHGSLSMQGKQTLQPQTHQSTYQQGPQVSFSPREEPEFQRGKESVFSQSSIQQPGLSFFQDRPQTGTPPVQSQQQGSDAVHQHNMGRPMFQPHQGSTNIHDQRPGVPPMGSKMGYGDDLHGRSGNEFYFNPNKGSVVAPHSKMAPGPLPQNQMEMELRHHVISGHANGSNSAMAHMKNPVVGAQTFAHNVAGVPPVIHGSLDGTELSAADAYRREHEISATGANVPAPFMTFEATGFPAEILREIHFAGFPSPTPIQAQTWPISLQSRDIVAIAKTGSGKTLGYLVPAFIHLRQCLPSSQNGPKVLILAPTRELATQIQDETVKFGRSSGISCTCLYGGAPKGPQIRDLDRGVDIVVATPGRLNDILEMKKIDFRQVSFLVLDEADRMLDMGFEPQIRKIVNEIPPHRQTLMYTATWPKEVRKIAGDLLVNPVQVNIGRVDELAANKSITQYVEVVTQINKQRRLEQILSSQERGSKVIIFCSTKRLCDQLTRSIGRSFGAAAIHGDKSQGERDHVLNQFRSGKSPILVATDVAARGLDIKDIRMVINYDFPTGIEDYVHRIGRTGRAGATGVAYTFFSDQDRKHASDLVKVLEGANQLVPPELQEMAACGRPSFVKNHNGIPRGDSRDGGFGGRGFGDSRDGGFGGRGGDSRDGGFGGRGGMRDGGFGGRADTRDGGFGGRGDVREGGFGGRGGMRDGGFGGRGGPRDDGFGGRRGRNDFGGRGNQGRVSSGPGRGFGRNDSGPPERYNNDGRGQFNNRRGMADGGRGRSFGRNHSASPDMVSTWDTRSSSSGRSSSRSRSRSRSRSLTRSRTRSRQRSRSRSRSRSRDGFRRADRATQESKFSSVSSGGAGAVMQGNHLPDKLPPLHSSVGALSATSVDGDKPNPEPGADVECADGNDP